MKSPAPLRILILTHEGDIAGSTMSVSFLAKGMAERGHHVTLGCKKNSLYKSLLEKTNVIIEHIPFTNKWDRVSIRIIRDIVHRDQINIINAQSSYDRYLSIFAKWLYKLPVKLVHTRRQMPLSVGGLQSWFYTNGTDQIIAVSKGVKDALVKKGIPDNHITVIFNGTPAEKYANIDEIKTISLKQEYGLNESDFIVGTVSRLKKQIQLYEALKYIEKPLTAFFIGISADDLGVNPDDAATKRHRIYFCGSIDPTEVLNYYKLFNLYVLPSTTEGLSQAILEAMFLALPVIATKAGGNPDLIKHNENGLLFEDGDVEKLADEISSIREDDKLASRLSEASRKTAHEDFSIERTMDNYELFFQKLISN